MNDITKFSKPIEKLIDVISGAIGTWYKPKAIRKEAEAKAYETEVLAKADAKRKIILEEADSEIAERAAQRLATQEIRRQQNIESIAEKAVPHLEENVSEQPVDEDWKTRFFKKSQDVSNKEMQEIWAKILAGEVSNPGKISIRTLDILSNLSKEEAEKFQRICAFVSDFEDIWKIEEKLSLDKFGISYGDLIELRDAGLIYDNDNLSKSFSIEETKEIANFRTLTIGHIIYGIIPPKGIIEFSFGRHGLTQAGKDICKTLNVTFNKKYEKKIIEEKTKKGYYLFDLEKDLGNEISLGRAIIDDKVLNSSKK